MVWNISSSWRPCIDHCSLAQLSNPLSCLNGTNHLQRQTDSQQSPLSLFLSLCTGCVIFNLIPQTKSLSKGLHFPIYNWLILEKNKSFFNTYTLQHRQKCSYHLKVHHNRQFLGGSHMRTSGNIHLQTWHFQNVGLRCCCCFTFLFFHITEKAWLPDCSFTPAKAWEEKASIYRKRPERDPTQDIKKKKKKHNLKPNM